MWCYELTHFNDKSNDIKKIGYFSSLSFVQSAISYLNTKPGFRENKNGFLITQRWLDGEVQVSSFYEVLVYYHTVDYSFEYENVIGLFASKMMAETTLQSFQQANINFTAELETEHIINHCTINQIDWKEGFTTEKSDPN